MSTFARISYSVPQRALHWIMFALIGFNLIFSDGMEHWIRVVDRGNTPTVDEVAAANIHAYVGIAVLVLALLRLALRLVQGAPEAPPSEPAIAKLAAKIAHWAFYLLFLLIPATGIGAYYFGNDTAGSLHGGPLKALMWLLIVVHVLGVLIHQFYWKTEVLKRMTSGTARAS